MNETEKTIRVAARTILALFIIAAVTAVYGQNGLGDGTTTVKANANNWWQAAYWICILDCFWRWLLSYTFSFFSYLVTALLTFIPSGWAAPMGSVTPYMTFLNKFLPVAEAMVLFSIWFGFWATFVLIKYTLKLIPTIG